MAGVVRSVIETVQIAVRNSDCNDSEVLLDGIILSLNQSSLALGELLNFIILEEEVHAQPELIVNLQEIRGCIDMILLNKQKIISKPGRKKKPLNIPMVSMSISSVDIHIIET